MIKHITSIGNIKDNKVIDPLKTKHGVITALRISELSGWIDPVTHLNLDFFSHLMNVVFVAKKLEKGARMVLDGDKFMYASVDRDAYHHYGEVDVVKRNSQMKNAIHRVNVELSGKTLKV